jgi:threonine dehydrogenase-like Zn-dependent dehydrogenase
VDVTLVDVDEGRAEVGSALGVRFAPPSAAPSGRDLVVHCSATPEGLQSALDSLAPDGTVIEVSWYGDKEVAIALGGAFHSQRLTIRASQVGQVALPRRSSRTTRDRLALALELLRDDAFDALLEETSAFADLPETMTRLATTPGLCHVISYDQEE